MIDVARVPDGLKDGVGETENENVLRCLLPKKMIDAVSLIFGEGIRHDPIQFLSGSEVAAERLFNDDPGPAALLRFIESGGFKIFQDRFEFLRRCREIK